MEYSDVSSTCSDVSESFVSSISGCSGYLSEFKELQHLINPDKYSQLPQRNYTVSTKTKQQSEYEEKIARLSNELQNALILNGKYKSQLTNLETKIQLSFHEKIETLIRKNKQLHTQLQNSNCQIERLIKNFGNGDKLLATCTNCLQLEKDLNTELLSLKEQLHKLQSTNNKLLSENKQYCIEIQDLKPQIEIKNVCINDLKQKITNQHVEIQSYLKNSDSLSSNVKNLKNELEHIRKSEEWYKQQLHLCQNDKKIMAEDILKYKTNLSSKSQECEYNKIELKKWRDKYENLELECTKDAGIVSRFIDVRVRQENNKCWDLPIQNETDSNKTLAKYYEGIIQDLAKDISMVKKSISEKDDNYNKISKENSELMSQCLMLQKKLELSELKLEDSDNLRKILLHKVSLLTDSLNIKSSEAENVFNELQNIKIEVTARNQEKEMVEHTVETIRKQFSLLKINYATLKKQLHDKNKEVLQLQKEKQELFMNNNWNLCELEKVKEQLLLIKKLQDIIGKNEKNMESMQKTISEQVSKIEALKMDHEKREESLINENLKDKNKLLKELEVYDTMLVQYKSLIEKSDMKTSNLQQKLTENNLLIEQLKYNLEMLKNHIHEKDLELMSTREKCDSLSREIQSFENVIIKLRAQIKLLQTRGDHNICKIFNTNNSTDVQGIKNINNWEISEMKPSAIVDENNLLETQNYIPCNPVEEKCYMPSLKCQECINADSQIDNKICSSEEIKNLKALLTLKELEKKERQKKYESNYRVLLKKVKEHMKERSTAEKQNSQIQSMYNALFDECNTLKLQLSSKEMECSDIKIIMESYVNINNKLKERVSVLEEGLELSKNCIKCHEYEIVSKRLCEMEKNANNLQEQISTYKDTCNNLQQQVQELLKLKEEYESKKLSSSRLEDVLEQLDREKNRIETYKVQQREFHHQLMDSKNENELLKLAVLDIKEKYVFLEKENKILSCKLHSQCEDLKQLEQSKMIYESDYSKREEESSNIIKTLKTHLKSVLLKLDAHKTEQFFLQRLCNDLKIALQANINKNAQFKSHVTQLLKEKPAFSSLPVTLPDLPKLGRYNDKYINELLQQNKLSLEDKPLSEIKGCLDSLKNEIDTLQQQVSNMTLNT